MRKPAAACLLLLLAGCQSAPHHAIQPPPSAPSLPPSQQTTEPVRPPHPVPSYAGTAGPLVPAGVGRYMDGMERDLRRFLKGTPVARPGDALALNLRDDALFGKDGGLSEDGSELLKALAAALRHYDRTLVQVSGYTDTRFTPERNLTQSQKHADAVAAALRADGVGASRLTATGFGRTHLKIATGDGRSEPRNRRVEIRILPHPG